jgi:hypothetical protein
MHPLDECLVLLMSRIMADRVRDVWQRSGTTSHTHQDNFQYVPGSPPELILDVPYSKETLLVPWLATCSKLHSLTLEYDMAWFNRQLRTTCSCRTTPVHGLRKVGDLDLHGSSVFGVVALHCDSAHLMMC